MSDGDRPSGFSRPSSKRPDRSGGGRAGGPGGRGPRRPGGSGRGTRPPMPLDVTVLYGWHPVAEALRNPARVHRRLMATENAMIRMREEVGEPPCPVEIVRPGEIDRLLTPDAVHQGLYLECEPLEAPELDELGQDALVLVLDQITDPHNVGAMLRSAAAFGVDAVIVTVRHSPDATGVLAKSASGALEHVPIIGVRNLGDALLKLKDAGYMRVGFDSEAAASFEEVRLTRPLALVMGAEGKGLRQRTQGLCDAVARLDMPGAIKSLNVSNATAIALYSANLRLGRT